MLLFGFFSNAQDIGVSNVILVEGTLDTSVSSVTYDLCATNPITLNIVLENFSSTSDTVSKVTLGITGVNSTVRTEFTISSPITLSGNSSTTVTYPDDFSDGTAINFSNYGRSTITVSSTSVSATGDLDTDNDAFYIVGNVYVPDTPTLNVINGTACQGEAITFEIASTAVGTAYKFYVGNALAYQGSNTTVTFSTNPADLDALSDGDRITIGFTDSNGCEVDTSTISYTVDINPLPSAGISSDKTTVVCKDDTVVFTATGGTEYAFYKGGVAVQSRSSVSTYTTSGLSNTESLTVLVYNSEGCEDQATLVMNVMSISSAGSITFSDTSDASICYGNSPAGNLSSTLAASGSHDISYQWKSSTNGTDWENIVGQTGLNYSPPQLFQTTYFKRVASVSTNTIYCSTDGDSNVLTISVNAAFNLTLTSSDAVSCIGDALSFDATVGAVSYTFYINGVSAQVSSSASLYTTVSTTTSIANKTVKNNDIITVIAEDLNGCTVSETITVVSSDTPLNPSLSTSISGNILCSGDTVVITASGGLTYAFELNSLPAQASKVSGNIYTIDSLIDGDVVGVTVSNAEGCTATTSMTFEVVSLVTAGTVTITNVSELEICYGAPLTATLSSTAAATSSNSVSYQWQTSTDGATYFNVNNQTAENLDLSTLSNLTETTYFRRLAYAYVDSNGNGALDAGEVSCTNNTLAYPVVQIEVDDSRTPSITSSTGSFAFCENDLVTFTLGGGVTSDTFTWELSDGTTTTSTGSVTSAATTTSTVIVAGGSIKVTLTTAGGCEYSVTQAITLVNPPTATVTATALTVCDGDTVTLTAGPSGQVTYTFRVGSVVKQSGSQATFTTAGLATTTIYEVDVYNSSGCYDTASIEISVPELSSAGTISLAAANRTLCEGAVLSTSIIGDGSSGGSSATLAGSVGSIAYRWQISYDNEGSYENLVGATGANLTPAQLGTISQTVHVRREAYVLNGGVECASDYTTSIQLTLDTVRTPLITSSTGSFAFCENTDVIFNAGGANGTDTYTWEWISGGVSNSSTGTTTNVTIVDSGSIKLTITTAAGCVYSTTRSITLDTIPPVLISADAYTICGGESVTVTVTNPVGAYTYTYIKEDVAVVGATATTTANYTFTNLADGDVITVEATDTSTGCSGSTSVTINVINSLTSVGSITRADNAILCGGDTPSTIFGDGTSGTASATTTTGTIKYQWYYKTAAMADFIVTGTNPLKDQSANYSPGALYVTTTYKRQASVEINGVSCSESFSLTEEIQVYEAEGGSLDATSGSVCFSFGDPAPTLTITGSSVGDYQWEVSTDGINFTDITGATQEDFTPTITATGTFYYQRKTTATSSTCSDTSDRYTLVVGETGAGSLDTSPTAIYCNGTQPPMLGIGTSVNGTSALGVVTYRWEYKIEGAVGGYAPIANETNSFYQPPHLFASPVGATTSYLYRRITLDAGSCESPETNVVTITIAPEIDPGYLDFQNSAPDNYFICVGSDVDSMIVQGATAVVAGVVTYTWENSTDLVNWSTVVSSSSNPELTFGTSNTPSVTTYYRVKISSGEGAPSSTSSTLNLLLVETNNAVTIGEVYTVYIGGDEASITTTAAVSTTDTIGTALALAITNDINGYNATYYADQNIIKLNTFSDEVSLMRTSSNTLFLDMYLLSYDSSDDFCSVYTNVITVNIYEPPSLQINGGIGESQTICVGEAMNPISYLVSGNYETVEISGIDDNYTVTAGGVGSATYSATTGTWTVSNTNTFTISGTPDLLEGENTLIQIETSGNCEVEASTSYLIYMATDPNTPDIIYRNNPQNSRELNTRHIIFERDGSWFNNTVCQDLDDVLPQNDKLTYEFAACYSNNQDSRYIKYDWEIIPSTAVTSIVPKNTPTTKMQVLMSLSYDSDTVTFTAGLEYDITITGPDGGTDTVQFTTAESTAGINLESLRSSLNGLSYVSATRSGNVITLTADVADEAGYFSIQVVNPTAAEILIGSPEYVYPEQNSAIEVVFSPNFGTTTPTSGGVTATLRVRAESTLCNGEYSDWYEVELYVVSDPNTSSDLPELREPLALSNTYCLGTTNNSIPSCEIQPNGFYTTTFYSAALSGVKNTYAYIEYKIDNIVSNSSVAFPGMDNQIYGGIDPEYGNVRWNPGFHGQFDICIRAVACDGTTGDWDKYTHVISPENAMPNVYASNIPVCPPVSGTATSTFSSDLMVNWTITPSTSYSSTSTRSVNGLDVFDVVWKPGYSGMAWVTADVKECAGDPRYFTVRIPENPVMTLTSSVTSQSVCQGEAITPIVFNVTGYSVIGVDDSELPDGLTGVYSTTTQQATIKISRRQLWQDDSENKYIMSVDYTDYTYNATGSESLSEFATAITNILSATTLIGSATVTTSNNSSTITIVGATPGIRFNIASNTPDASRYFIGQPVIDSFSGTFTVSGNISETLTVDDSSYQGTGGAGGKAQMHLFNLSTISSGASCTTDFGEVVINYSPSHSITTVTPTLLSQFVCDGDSLSEIEFTLSGGAYDYEAPVWYPSEPNGVVFSPEAGDVLGSSGTSFTLSGTLNTGVTTTTVYHYTITTTGTTCDIDSITGTLVVYPKEEIKVLPASNQQFCVSEYIDLQFDFEGISGLVVSSTSSLTFSNLGLISSYTYTSSPSVDLTIVASATSVGEVYQVELIDEFGALRAHSFTSASGSESTTVIASALATKINTNPFVSASLSSTESSVIEIVANTDNYVFWVRINSGNTGGTVEHNDVARMRVTEAVAVEGTFSLTGTPTIDISETTSYSLIISTPGNLCSAASETFVFELIPDQIISITSSPSTQTQTVCDGEAIEDVTFYLEGTATGYSANWSNGAPAGLTFGPTSANLFGTSTVTLSGTLNTGNTTTTVYYYTLTTDGTSCESTTVTGSIVVHPKEEILLPPNTPVTYDISDYIELEYSFEGIRSLTLSSTSSSDFSALGLTSSLSYTTTPSVELTIITSPTFAGQAYRVEIIEEDGSTNYFLYQAPLGTESITTVASALATKINADPDVTAAVSSTDSSVIEIVALNQEYVFWVRVNEGSTAGTIAHYDNATMRVTDATPVRGVYSLTGTPTALITETTSYTFIVITPGIQCTTDSETTVVFIVPEAQISLTSSDSTLNQELTNGSDVESTTFILGGDADGYTTEWPNGQPAGITITPESDALFGTSTLTLSGELSTDVTTTTIYYYTITAYDGTEAGDSITGSIVVHPKEVISLTPPSEVSYCSTDYISLTYEFEGYGSLAISSTSSLTVSNLGISRTLSYFTTPTVEITVVASATSLNEDYQIEIVEEDGGSTSYLYRSTTATESIENIATGLAAAISGNSKVNATSSGAIITIEAVSSNYIFWTRINDGSTSGSMESYDKARMLVTGAVAVRGELTITGTPTVSITETTSYTVVIVSPGIRDGTDATSTTTVITLKPEQTISLSSSATTLNQVLCDNTAIEDIVFQLGGSATDITGLVWLGDTPGGILQPAVSASNTLSLTGTISTGVTITTVYTFSITTSGNSCESNTVTGSFTVNPDHYIAFEAAAQNDQTVCDLSAIDPIEFEISGGATGVSVAWTNGNPGLTVFLSNNSSTTYIISGTLNTGITTETTYPYTITTQGNSCATASLTGEITVIPQLVINVDTPLTQNQIGSNALCNGDDIEAIDFSFTSGNSPTFLEVVWTDSEGTTIQTPGPTLNGYSLTGPISTSSTELTTYYYTVNAKDTNASCVFTAEFSGTIQVSPDINVYQEYIQNNDVTDVSCTGNLDGSIIINATTAAEFALRIDGGQVAQAQIDKVTLSVSDTLDAGDQISVLIDGITFTSVVASGTTTQTMLEELRDKVNFGTGSAAVNVTAAVVNDGSEIYLQLVADTAGTAFVASGTTITSTVTGTTVVSTTVENKNLNYEYTWTKDGVFRGSSLNLENLEAGTYTLAVSINGCEASTTYDFVVQEPTITLGTVSETCNGDISIPITAILTASQLSIAGDKITAELYERGVDNAYSVLFGTQSFATAQSSNSFVANFYNLTQGETYQLVVTDNTCNERTTLEIGPLNTEITINENSITTTDEECYGEGGTLAMSLNAISNGSGYYSYEWTNLSTGSKYNTRNVTGADAGLYELTVTDQNYGCEVTTTGIIEIEAVVTDLTVAWSAASPITNDCYDSREGTLEVVVTGGSGDFFYEWYFTAQTASVTLLLNNDSPILEVDNVIPASYYAGGEYYVLVYDGGGTASCASSGTKGNPFVIINPEELSFATASSTISNIACAGDESGSIYVEVAGGSGNYLYTINGGVPYIPSTGVISENNLAAGNYTLIVEDADNSCGTAQQITQAITISEPAGGALTLALGEVAEIPCDGGLGSIEIEISGGSPLTSNSASSVIDYYSVKVVRQGGGFTLNTTHDPANTSLVIENLTTAGTYDITVSDTNGCTETLTNILLNNSSNGLAATGVITQATGCNEVSLTEGATITVNWPDRGDGNNGGYPLWQQRTSVNLDSFTIAFNGTVTGVDVSTLGVAITTTTSATVFASSTASTTFSSVQDVAAQLAYNINLISDLTATLNGSTIIVKGLIIGSASALTSSASTLNISVSGISQVADTKWSDVPGMAGMEVISGLSAGYYRAIINDSSGCGGTLVQNSSQGGSIFQIDEPQSLQFASIVFDEVTCNQPTSNLQFKLSNGVYTYSPDPSAFEFTLNSVLLTSTVEGSVSFTTGTTTTSLSLTTSATTSSATTSSATTSAAASVVGSTYTPNLRTNTVEIKNLIPGNYELVVENIQTECIAVLNFTINDASSITYSGETNFDIDPCYETYQELFFDQFLIDGGEPFQSSDGESFYSLKWTFDPSDPDENTSTISSLSNNVNFAPRAGTYELLIYDSNGCTILDENGLETPIEFTFSQSLTSLQVLPAGGANGDEFATPVSCEIGAEDGQINIDVESSDPYEIKWHVQQSTTSANEQRLLFQGISAAVDSLEVYAIRINDIPISYATQQSNEPITSVVNEFAQRINDNALFTASVDPTENPNEIIVKSASNAAIDLEIVSQSTRLLMINSSSNGATWVALDGTNGYPNYTGYLSLNSLAEGQYRYTISAVNVANCDNGAEPSSVQGIITVENENILEIREGPIVDDYLCNGQSGTLFIDVFDGNTGPLSFFYNSTPVTYEVVGTNQYIINIDNPVETATLEIYNAANCGLSREINIGNGTPLFEFNSVNFLQSGTFLAREDITFIDNSENEYDSFEFVFGDGTQTDVLERNTPEPITHEYAISGTYYVTLRIYNDLGCSEELTKLIKIGKGYSILVPNVFSPNGDIWNNTFRPIFNGLSEIILRVYDAQGGLLYEEAGAEGSDPDKLGLSLRGWEGNKNLPSSPYFIYTITAKTIDDEPVFRDGTFILLQ